MGIQINNQRFTPSDHISRNGRVHSEVPPSIGLAVLVIFAGSYVVRTQ